MSFFHFIDPLYSLSGFAVGLLVGITGVGGGSLMTPLLVLVFGIHPATAVGTDLLYAAITKAGGALVHGRNRTVDWRVTGWLALGSIPATAVTILFLSHLAKQGLQASGLIATTLGVALILTAGTLLFRGRILRYFAARGGAPSPVRVRNLTILCGLVLGVLVSLSSVGAGAIGGTLLLILYPRLPIVRIVGSDIAHAVPVTLIAGIGHCYLGDINWALLGSLLVGSLPGIVLGSNVAKQLPERALRLILATTLLLLGFKLLH